MTSTQNQSEHLFDSDYISWAEKEKWTLTEAVFVLHGRVPPGSELEIDQLIEEFPDEIEEFPDEGVLRNLPKPWQEGLRKSPEDWAFQLMYAGRMSVTGCWWLIYPQWIPDDFGITRGKKVNYRRFFKVLGPDTDTPLGELVSVALNLGDKKMVNPPREFYYLLDDMAQKLDIKANYHEELRGWLVSPRQFAGECPETKFVFELLNSNPNLAAWLKAPGKAKKVRSRTKNSDKSLAKKGGDTRGANYKKLELRAIELYQQGNFPSVRAASFHLVASVKQYAVDNALIPLTEKNAQSTIYKWLRKHVNQSK